MKKCKMNIIKDKLLKEGYILIIFAIIFKVVYSDTTFFWDSINCLSRIAHLIYDNDLSYFVYDKFYDNDCYSVFIDVLERFKSGKSQVFISFPDLYIYFFIFWNIYCQISIFSSNIKSYIYFFTFKIVFLWNRIYHKLYYSVR